MNATASQQNERVRIQDSILRVNNIIGNPAKGIPPLVPIARATLWAKVANGTFPKPLTGVLGPKMTCWKMSQIQEYINRLSLGKAIPEWTYRENPDKKKSGKHSK